MRKILFILITILLIVFFGLLIYQGRTIFNIDVWGIPEIKLKNAEIDNVNAELSDLVENSYPNALADLESTAQSMEEKKSEYESQAVLLKDSKYYRQSELYKLEFLWTRIDKYKNENDVKIKIDVVNSSTEGFYNLNFTVVGEYADVAQFIRDIEEDSRLGFKIENFKMESASTTVTTNDNNTQTENNGEEEQQPTEVVTGVQGTFTCKEIRIDIKKIDSSTSSSSETQNDTNNNTNTNNSNSTSTNTTNNTATNDTAQENAVSDDTTAQESNTSTTENVSSVDDVLESNT